MKWSSETQVRAAIVVALAFLLVNSVISYRAESDLTDHERSVTHTYQVLSELEAVLATMTDAESGSRGYIISRDEHFLEPYRSAVANMHRHVAALHQLTADNPRQERRIPILEQKIQARLDVQQRGIEMTRTGRPESARLFVASGIGKRLMDDLRADVAVMQKDENDLLQRREVDARGSRRAALLTLIISYATASALAVLVGYVIIRALAARRRDNEILDQQREWFRVTLSSIGDAVIATDIDGCVTFLNPVAESLTGWRAGEAAGRPILEVFNVVNEETRRAVDNPALRAMREGVIVGLANHTVLVSRSGNEIPIEDSGAPIRDSAGNLLGAVLVFRDGTARRAADESFHVAVEASPAGMILVDETGRIIFVNSQIERLFGYSRNELIEQQIEMLVPERFRHMHPDHRAKFSTAPQTRPMGAGRDLTGLRKDGHEVPIEIALNPVSVRGRMLVLSSVVDISARRQQDMERTALLAAERTAREQAEAANRARDEFVALISHEIRSPLTAVLGWAQMLLTETLDEAATTRAIETIIHNSRAQVRLIEDLMDISRAITGKLRLNVRPLDPVPIVDDAIDAIRPAAGAKSIKLDVYRSEKRGMVSGDPDRLQQIVHNLLTNAIRFTPEHGRILIAVEHIHGQMRITISDSGIGIEKEFLPFVFDRFTQASTSSERRFSGLGLGLAIVRHLVELHGGTVRAESAGVGKGATFAVDLPVLTEIGAAAVQASRISDPKILDGIRVVVVDDEADTRDLLVALLVQRGAEVRSFPSAAEALHGIEEWPPSVLVSDIAMPQEDGHAFMRKLRLRDPARGGSTPAIALTAYARSEDRVRALESGFQMYVPKPVEATELIATVARLACRL